MTTTRLITSEHKRVSAWVAEQIGCEPWPDATTLGWEKDGELIAGVVLDGYMEKGSASLHCAGIGKRWLTRQFLFSVFDYCFRQLDLKVLINRVAGGNEDSVRFTKHIGFNEFARFPLAWDGVQDMVLLELRRENCRWLGERHGQ